MLDFKLYDIPSAMTESLTLHLTAGADITTVHCTSGYDPAAHGLAKNHIAGVTILTSIGREDFKRYYRGQSPQQMVAQMAAEAVSRYAYLVCSATDLESIKALDIKKICPGIRPSWYREDDDQHRTATPAAAIRQGADLLVIGRPLLGADDIVGALERTNAEIAQALTLRTAVEY
jgi:orotidine-5'-phosphate decarboxylase